MRRPKLAKQIEELIVPAWAVRPEILLDPPIPQPLSGTAPRVVLGSAWWDRTRKEAALKTNLSCIVCKDRPQLLHGHERYEVDWLMGHMTYLETVPLCPDCHSFIHPGYLKTLVKAGKVSSSEYQRVIDRGLAILREAGLSRPDDAVHRNWASVEWQDWRLIVEGKEYPPLYASWEEYQETIGGQP